MEPSADEKAVIKKQFINVLSAIMASLGKSTMERDIRKAYREEEGHNINIVLDKLGVDNLYNFLRFHCKAICNVICINGDVRIVRISNENSAHMDYMTKAHKKKNNKKTSTPNKAPKLNFPRTGLINENTFPRLNPQGFAKNKPANQEAKPLSSLPHYRPNYQQTFRPASQLSTFKAINGPSTTSSSSKLINIKDDAEDELQYIYVRNAEVKEVEPEAAKWVELKAPPKVHNPFDFPLLPTQVDEQHDDDDDEHQSEEESEHEGSDQEMISYEASLEEMTVGTDNEARVRRPRRLDSPIFRIDYPEIIQDCRFKIPKPKLKTFDYKLLFEIHMVVVFSPSQFYFQYGEQTIGALMNELNHLYSIIPKDDLGIDVFKIKPGLIVAAKVYDSWHRAQVMTQPDDEDKVMMLFVDFGTQIAVNVSDIRYLLKVYAVEPSKALRGSLFGICPKDEADEWEPFVRQQFFARVANKKLFATIKSYFEEGDVYELEVNETVSGVMSVNEQMVLSKLADQEVTGETFPFAIPMETANEPDLGHQALNQLNYFDQA